MKLLPFKLSEQENQSLKGTSKGKPFKSFQKEVVIYLILLVLAFVFLWKHHNLLILVVVAIAAIIGVRYSQVLKSSKATYSIGEKVEKEIKEQQELTKKVALPIIFGMVGFFILFMVALVVYVFYLKPYLSPKPEVTFPPVGQEQKPLEEIISDETADWQTYRNEEYRFEMRYPADWTYSSNLQDWITFYTNDEPTIYVQISDNPHNLTVSQWITNKEENENWKLNSEEIILDGVKGIKWVYEQIGIETGEKFTTTEVYCAKSKFVYEMSFTNRSKISSELFDQILSTFRFVD